MIGLNYEVFVTFKPFDNYEAFPFPLYLNFGFKALLSAFSMLIFFFGIKQRIFIFRYLKTVDTKKPMNILILIDQINGLLLGFGIIFKIIAILSPVPLSNLFGNSFCQLTALPGCMYTVGKIVWSCFVALLRIVYIKAQSWLKFTIGEKSLVYPMLLFGVTLVLSVAFLLVKFDNKNAVKKICLHHSDKYIDILEVTKIRIKNLRSIFHFIKNISNLNIQMASCSDYGALLTTLICHYVIALRGWIIFDPPCASLCSFAISLY